MTIHKKSKKRIFKLLIIGLCLGLSISTLIAFSNKTNKNVSENKKKTASEDNILKDEEQIELIRNPTNIAFEKNNNVYLYDETSKKIKSIGDDLKSKDLLNISPDKTKLIFREFNEDEPAYPPHVTIYNIKTEELIDIIIDNKNVQQIVDMKWVDNENILLTGHINPSSSGYAVYNIKSKIELISCVGTIRDVTISKKNILYSSTPHVFPQLRANLFINNNKIFEVQNVNEEILDGVLSKDGKALAFRSWVANEKDLNSEVIAYLNVAKINSDGKSISDLKKISLGTDTSGNIKFDGENNVVILGDEFIYKLKEDVLSKEKNTLSKEEEIDYKRLENFKNTLAEQFPYDFITEQTILEDIDIYNIMAF